MTVKSEVNQVLMDLSAHEKMWAWARLARGEVSMLGLVEDTPEGPVIADVFLPGQTCSSSHTEMDPADVARLLVDLEAVGRAADLRAWIHSHGEMEVFWSRTDDECIERLANGSYVVSVVVNRNGRVRARVDVFRPMRIVIDDLPVRLRVPDQGVEEACRSEFQARVRETPMFATVVRARPNEGQRDLFPRGPLPRPFTALDLEELEEAVRRGEIGMQEYVEAVEACERGEMAMEAGLAREKDDGWHL